MTTKTDTELVKLVLDTGDTAAFGELVKRYQGHVYGLAYSILRDWAEAQDMAQETFIRAYVNLGTLRDHDKFPAWLRRIAFSTCMDWLKTFRPEFYRSLGEPKDVSELDLADAKHVPPPAAAEKNEMSGIVLEAISHLPAKYRIPITMFHLDGLSYERVAEFLDVPLGTAKSLIHYAKKMLKPALEAVAPEVAPVVQEVFKEHKLSEDFPKKVAQFIKAACWGRLDEATRLLAEAPELGTADIYTAAILGDIDTVQQMLERNPSLATQRGGVWSWEPLLYLA